MITIKAAIFIAHMADGYPLGTLREAHAVIRMATPFTDECWDALIAVHNAIVARSANTGAAPAINAPTRSAESLAALNASLRATPCIECGGSGVQFARGRCEACADEVRRYESPRRTDRLTD